MDFNKLVARAKAVLLSPATEWPVIASEPATVTEIFKTYVVWLAAITAVAGFIGSTIVGYSVPFLGTYRMGFGAGLAGAVTTLVLSLAGVLLLAYLTDVLAPRFGGEKSFTQAVKAVAYAYTATWIAGVGLVLPGLRWVIVLAGGAYSIYLFYLGLPYTMKCPRERARRYAVITIIAAVVVRLVLGVVAANLGLGFTSYGYSVASSSGGFEPASRGEKLERWAQGLEAASQKMQAAQQRGDYAAAGQAAGALVGATLGVDATVEALAPERIRAFLPASLGSLARGPISVQRGLIPLVTRFSEAQAQYSDGRGHSIRLRIRDTGGASGLVSLASWLGVEEEKQTPAGFRKTYKSGNRMVSEQWNTPAGQNTLGYGEYTLIVGQRYLVQASGQVADIDTLKGAVGSVDLATLESLSNEGVHAK